MATYTEARDTSDLREETVRFHARDGRELEADLMTPSGPARAQVVVHGATAVPRRHYLPFARELAARGYRVLVYDYRGVGGSAAGHPRHDPATMSDWFEHDAPAAVETLVRGHEALPLFAVGHSFGGQVAAALEGVPAPRAIATMGAQRGYWATFPWHVRPRMWLNWFVLLPALTGTLSYLPAAAGLGTDMPAGIVRQWARWCREPEYYLREHPELGARLAAWDGQLLALSVTDDDFAPLANVEWLQGKHAAARVEHLRFTPEQAGTARFGHFGFFRASARETVWQDVFGFFEEQLGAQPAARVLPRAEPASRGRASVLSLDEADVLHDFSYGRG